MAETCEGLAEIPKSQAGPLTCVRRAVVPKNSSSHPAMVRRPGDIAAPYTRAAAGPEVMAPRARPGGVRRVDLLPGNTGIGSRPAVREPQFNMELGQSWNFCG